MCIDEPTWRDPRLEAAGQSILQLPEADRLLVAAWLRAVAVEPAHQYGSRCEHDDDGKPDVNYAADLLDYKPPPEDLA